ncbi:HAD family hydrolase [Radiobacillus sp. PE A8.2]|uniref:HAD family hydrolase n=1 Tax=Radiobacillus sp. PE A8.2 TaxID=3380349 RepID=UPI00388D0A00
MIPIIFFDIDATLMDHETAEHRGALAFYRFYKNEIPCQEAAFIQQWKSSSKRYFNAYLANELSFQEQRRLRIKEMFGVELMDKQADQLFENYLAHYQSNWQLFDDVIPCLDSLNKQGYLLGIVTNGDDKQQKQKLQKLGVLHYFSMHVTSSQVGCAKPNPSIFREACALAQVKSTDCYYVGDQLLGDVISSIKAGMHGVWLNRQKQLVPRKVRAIQSLKDLEQVISSQSKDLEIKSYKLV